MSNETNNQSKGRYPDAVSHIVRKNGDGSEKSVKLGAAWDHNDGNGLTIKPDDPLYGDRIVLRKLRNDAEKHFEQHRHEQQAAKSHEQDRGRDR